MNPKQKETSLADRNNLPVYSGNYEGLTSQVNLTIDHIY